MKYVISTKNYGCTKVKTLSKKNGYITSVHSLYTHTPPHHTHHQTQQKLPLNKWRRVAHATNVGLPGYRAHLYAQHPARDRMGDQTMHARRWKHRRANALGEERKPTTLDETKSGELTSWGTGSFSQLFFRVFVNPRWCRISEESTEWTIN